MAYENPELGRARDRERYRGRTAARRAQGLCPRCGETPPAPGRSLCEPCREKQRAAERARDAKRRDAGEKRYRDPEKARAWERDRHRRQTAERLARGLCRRCGKEPPAPDSSVCEPCGEKRRAAERARYARAKAAGKLYGGCDEETRRRSARARTKRRYDVCREAGLCTRCGKRPPVEGGSVCEPCSEARRAAEREFYAARRAAGLCGRCGEPAFDSAARCGPCSVIEAERSPQRSVAARARYARRRARGLCTDCGQPSQGAARCEPCAKRSYERSDHFRGLPLYPPRYTVIEVATGEDHGTWDSWDEVIVCLAFARLSPDQVEVLTDRSPMAIFAAYE